MANEGTDNGDAAAVANIVGDTGSTSTGDTGASGEVNPATPGVTEGVETPTWNYAEGIAGKGEAPDWFKSDKYVSVEAQAKAYKELEGRFGAFTGAPENYEPVKLSEELSEMGITINEDDPMVEEAAKFAKEANMDQEGFNKLINLYGTVQAAEAQALEQYRVDQLATLGTNAEARVNNLNAWATANLPPEMIEGFQGMATSAEAVKAMERLVSMTRAAPIAPDVTTAVTGPTAEDVSKMQFEKDRHGNRRIQTDTAFRKRYQELANKVHGVENHMIKVGG